MPRSGPRPYECVRKAWHSDRRHQPIRGSLIQEIFRVVHDIHSPLTKKKKEWQEKLPVVVLKAEDIMYSKANSEAEYMDLKTLWDRTNDAISTIIRLDETTETGLFLQPCIEAALHLGCTPIRASRSQRNITPSYYLSPMGPGTVTVTSSSMQNTTPGNHKITSQTMDDSHANKSSFSCLGMSAQSPAVYPLYFGDRQSKEPKCASDTAYNLSFHSTDLSKIQVKQNPYGKAEVLSKSTEKYIRDPTGNSYENGCDLSLRLGCLGSPCAIIENSIDKNLENLGLGDFQEGKKLNGSSIQIDKSFFTKSYIRGSVDTCSTDQVIEADKKYMKSTLRKRKAHLGEDVHFSWRPKLFRDCSERMRNTDYSNNYSYFDKTIGLALSGSKDIFNCLSLLN